MIEISNLTKSYGPLRAIDQLNFKVNKGEIVGFLGPNGAGKSTTMKIITGYMPPSDGMVKVSGFDVFDNPIEVKKRIGYLPETPPLYADMYVQDYLQYVAKLKGVPHSKIKSLVDKSLEKSNLKDVRRRMIRNLSKGFKQRVGIAQAIVSDPEILILDEPTVGLDPKQVAEIRTLIRSLAGHHTVILSTHILPEVQAICQRIIIINKGKIVAEDTLEGLNRRMSGATRIVLKVKRPSSDFEKSLSGVNGIVHVSGGQGLYNLDISDANAAEKIAEHVVKSNAGLLEMKSQDMNLEDIFIKLTS